MKIRGFKIKKHLRRLSKWILRRPKTDTAYHRLCVSGQSAPYECKSKAFSKLLTWSRRLSSTTRSLCSAMRPWSGYVPVGQEPPREKSVSVPKGYLAVYVGQKDGDYRRVLVPVIYFNHPLFGDLLREAEEEYGFNQQGGITIPCGVSEFERVKTRIAAGCGGRRMTWRRHRW